jgi:hypothetical protein
MFILAIQAVVIHGIEGIQELMENREFCYKKVSIENIK